MPSLFDGQVGGPLFDDETVSGFEELETFSPLIGASAFWEEGDYAEAGGSGSWTSALVGGTTLAGVGSNDPKANRAAPLYFPNLSKVTAALVSNLSNADTWVSLCGTGDTHVVAVVDLNHIDTTAGGSFYDAAVFFINGGNMGIAFWESAGSFYAGCHYASGAVGDASTFDGFKLATVDITALVGAHGRGRVTVQVKKEGGYLWIRANTGSWVQGDACFDMWSPAESGTLFLGSDYSQARFLDGTVRALGFYTSVQSDTGFSDVLHAWANTTFAADSPRTGIWYNGDYDATGGPGAVGQWTGQVVDLGTARDFVSPDTANSPAEVAINLLNGADTDGTNDFLQTAQATGAFLKENGEEFTIGIALLPSNPTSLALSLGTAAQLPYTAPGLIDNTVYVNVGWCTDTDTGLTGFVFGCYDGISRDNGGGANDGWQAVFVAAAADVPHHVQARLRGNADTTLMDIRVDGGTWVSLPCAACGYLAAILDFGNNYGFTAYLDADVGVIQLDRVALTDAECDARLAEAETYTAWSMGGGPAAYTMTTVTGDFVLDGANAGLTAQHQLTTAAGAFVESGANATLTAQRKLVTAVGAFVESGSAAVLTAQRKLSAVASSYALTGQDAVLAVSMPVAAGAFALAGQDAALSVQRKISAAVGAFTLTGQDAALKAARIFSVSAGSFSLVGNDVVLAVAMPAATGTFSVTGQDAVFALTRRLIADTGIFTLSGQAAGLAAQRKIATSPGSFTLTGNDVVLAVAMAAQTGAFDLAGIDVVFAAARKIFADTGTFSLVGNDAGVQAQRKLSVSAGSFSLVGQDAAFLRQHGMIADAASFSLVGNDASFQAAHKLSVSPASFSLVGNDAALNFGHTLITASGPFLLTGNAASFDVAMSAQTGALSVVGNDASLTSQRKLSTVVGAFSFTGNDASLLAQRRLQGDAAAFSLVGNAVGFQAGHIFPVQTGTFALAGQGAGLYAQRKISTTVGAFTLAGIDVNFALVLPVTTGVFVATGQAAGLYAQRRLSAAAASFAVAGNDANLIVHHLLTAISGSFALVGQSANFHTSMPADTGAFDVVGNDAVLTSDFPMTAETGVFSVAGGAASFFSTRKIFAETGVFIVTGHNAKLVAFLQSMRPIVVLPAFAGPASPVRPATGMRFVPPAAATHAVPRLPHVSSAPPPTPERSPGPGPVVRPPTGPRSTVPSSSPPVVAPPPLPSGGRARGKKPPRGR